MTYNEAVELLSLAADVDEFVDPPASASEAMAESMFSAQERREKRLEGLCTHYVRQMVLAEARNIVNGRVT